MRSLITVALGLLLLVSAAAAQGNSNTAIVTVDENTTDNLITGANLAQLSDLDSNLLGNNIFADQFVGILINDSSLTGNGNGRTNAIQMADLVLNSTGNANVDLQFVGLAQGGNDLTIGNITQMTVLEADDTGNDNIIDQSALALIGIFVDVTGIIGQPGSVIGSPNLLTNSDLKQTSILDATVKGNTNDAFQDTMQLAADNDLVNSKIFEQAAINANILGNENNLGIGSGQIAIQIADANLLTNSWANQLICLDEQIIGNNNDPIGVIDTTQFAETNLIDNLLTTSTALQSIDEKAREIGNGNFVEQDATLSIEVNSAVSGHIVQVTDIETNT